MSIDRKIVGSCSGEQAFQGALDDACLAPATCELGVRDEVLQVQEAFRQQVARKLSGTQGAGDDVKRRASWLVPVQ